MARSKKTDDGEQQPVDLRYPNASRKNIPPAGLEARGKVVKEKRREYSYNPHLPPVLRFDPTGAADALPELLEEAGRRPLTPEEQQMLAAALRNHQPWLEWTGKREHPACVVDPVGLHIHERVSAKAILATAARQDIARSLFADPEQDYREAVQFYQHDVDWSNRLILGDSLSVMASLARREALAGKVQMIYLDPPYGIKYSSNFQSQVGQREVKDKPDDLTREPEMVKAFRDTWNLGIHSYLSYLRDRIVLAKELLAETGSLFVQISDENLHRVTQLLQEVFGPENIVVVIAVQKTGATAGDFIQATADYVIWVAKDKDKAKFRQIWVNRTRFGSGGSGYNKVEESTGARRAARASDFDDRGNLIGNIKLWRSNPLTSDGFRETTTVPFEFEDRSFHPGAKNHWKISTSDLRRVARTERIGVDENQIKLVRYWTDSPIVAIGSYWSDLGGAANPVYVVQTNHRILERCIQMTTDPGDLVLDPTCGGGTTAYVAEQWGRRWITIDCSRVAIAITRQRLLTAKFNFYNLRSINADDVSRSPTGTWLTDPLNNISGACTFDCRSANRITLGSIGKNEALDSILERWEPLLSAQLSKSNEVLADVSGQLREKLKGKLEAKKKRKDKQDSVTDSDKRRWLLPDNKWEPWNVPFDSDPDYPRELADAIEAYRKSWRTKIDELNKCIDARAERVELVDQPYIDNSILRVCSPFTVEGVIPSEESIDFEGDSPIGGAPDELEAFGGDATFEESKLESQNAEAYVDKIIRLLRADGVLFPNNKQIKFDRLEAYASPGLNGEGVWTNEDGERKVAVVVAPQYGSLTAKMVEDGIRFASRRGFDELVFAGFSFDGAAQAAIQEDPDPHLRLHMAQIRPDVNMGDLLKTTSSSQIFTVSGTPRTSLMELADGELQVEMEGVDIYDPVTNTVRSTGSDKVAAWFVDSDYDGRCFCITQAFFPDKKAWEKLSKALVGTVDPDRFAAFAGTVSLPFPKGKHRRVAVKVIDPRGNEVMRVHKVGSDY